MLGARTPPFLRPDPRAFQCSPWMMGGGRILRDGELIKEWDQSLDISVSRVVRVDLGMVALTSKLPSGTRLALLASWWSDGTNLRGSGESSVLTLGDEAKVEEVQLGMTVPGASAAGNLQLRSSLVLHGLPRRGNSTKLSASIPGSILWEDSLFLVLEGMAGRFPITIVDFEQSGAGPKDACWLLEWSPKDLRLQAMAVLRLLINRGHSTFHRAATTADPTPTDLAIRSALNYQVAEEMIRMALDNVDEIDDFGDHLPPNSIGKVFLDLLATIFPERSPRQVADHLKSRSGEFHAELQSRLQLYAGLDGERTQ